MCELFESFDIREDGSSGDYAGIGRSLYYGILNVTSSILSHAGNKDLMLRFMKSVKVGFHDSAATVQVLEKATSEITWAGERHCYTQASFIESQVMAHLAPK